MALEERSNSGCGSWKERQDWLISIFINTSLLFPALETEFIQKDTQAPCPVLETGQVSYLVSLFSLRINQQTNGNHVEMPSCAQNKTPWAGFYQAWSERPSVIGNRPTDKECNKIKQVELLLKGAGEMLTAAKDHI